MRRLQGVKRECPTGVDMARMKTEFLYHWRKRHALRLRDRMVAYLPRYAPWLARLPWLANLRDLLPGAARLSERLIGLSARRRLPAWRADVFTRDRAQPVRAEAARKATDATSCSGRTPSTTISSRTACGQRAACCRRPAIRCTWRAQGRRRGSGPAVVLRPVLPATGLVDEARAEARTVAALSPWVQRTRPSWGLSPRAC